MWQVTEEQPSRATGRAAMDAGWSHSHRDVSGGWLRPTVFGAVDGLVTNASLISGLGGGGEYISVTNQNELVQTEVSLERQMLDRFPDAERAELAGYFREYGADEETAARMADAVSADPGRALRIHTREELGVDPEELPSPFLAGAASLLAFSLGALVPLLPYLVGLPRLAATLVLTAVALIVGGGAVGKITGRPILRSGLRQLLLGGLAVAVTFGVGHLIGSHSA
jgi:VIT1/CCC1 family predicted Fe2+/Mn2+ transporter